MNIEKRKYWLSNGFERRGDFWSVSFNIGWLGVLICKPFCNNPIFNFYKLED